MLPRPAQFPRLTRRALRVMTLFLGVWMMLVATSASAWAMMGAEVAADSCCCGEMSEKTHSDGQHPCEMAQSSDASTPASADCPCVIEQGDGLPVDAALALGSTTFSFAPAIVGALPAQISIPQPRAPSAPRSAWLYSHSPPQPLYLRHQTFLI